jgi:poly-beta-1,6-N-acetyl-D-glucosamine synthase
MLIPSETRGLLGNCKIALITPLKDEEQFIDAMIQSIVGQGVRPQKWLIIDDGSTDNTAAIVRSYCETYDFIELLQLPARSARLAGGEGAVPAGLKALDWRQFDYLARFDADLKFESDYFEQLLVEFARDPRLGIAGGELYVEHEGRFVRERAPEYHVRGALKMYRRECFEQLGGLDEGIGWDTIDEVSAWTKGWRTRSFSGIKVIHRRPTGAGMGSHRIYRERGRAEYRTWSHPAFVILKSLKIAGNNFTNARCFVGGFVNCYRQREPRLQDADFKRTRRKQQMARMFRIFTSESSG